MNHSILEPMNLTLVAYYGDKPEPLVEFIHWCQTTVAKHIPESFRPYELDQVHATIVGLEAIRQGDAVLNANYARLGEEKPMDLTGLLDFLQRTSLLPCRIRLGGFRAREEYPFTSLGKSPYSRSFAIQSSTIVVTMGWPEQDNTFPDTLNHLRRRFNQYNVIHKYHRLKTDIDNDLFFVLGKVESEELSQEQCENISEEIRPQIADRDPLYLDLALENLSLVAYSNPELPLTTSKRLSVTEAINNNQSLDALLGTGC
jgi:hypothetical protein